MIEVIKWNASEVPTEESYESRLRANESGKFFYYLNEWGVWLLWIYIFLENNKDPMTSSEATYISQFSTLLASSFWKRGGEEKINDFYKMCLLTIII
jgi:hypothetical protein